MDLDRRTIEAVKLGIDRRKAFRWLAAAAAAGFACLCYMYLTLPDVRPLRTSNPTTTAFMELRAREARARGKTPRHVQQWVSYSSISRNLTRAVLVAEDDAFWQHEGLDFEQLQESIEADWASGRFVRGGSTITQQLAKNLYLSPSKNPLRKLTRAHHRAAARGRADEGAHPRAVPERDRVGRRDLRRRSGGAHVFPDAARPRSSRRSRRCSPARSSIRAC